MKMINQQLIRNSNLKHVYDCIYTHAGISRSSVAKQMKLSKTAISALVDELIERGFVTDSKTANKAMSPGRKPNSLYPCVGSHYVIVLFWGEYYIDAHLADISGTSAPILRKEVDAPLSYVTSSRQCVEHMLAQGHLNKEQALGVCIVVPAMIDMKSERIFSTPLRFLQYEEVDLVKELKKVFCDFKIAILNDTACCAYAEKQYALLYEPDYAFINFDRGIGAVISVQGKMLGRASASYTQFGHYSVDPDGAPCKCGNKGCLEVTISEEALSGRYYQLQGLRGSQAQLSYRDLGYAAAAGDKEARRVLTEAAILFARALGNLIALVHPKLIMVGGKGRGLGDFFLHETERQLKKTGFHYMVDAVKLQYSLLGQGACITGAMKYFMDAHYAFNRDSEAEFFLG